MKTNRPVYSIPPAIYEELQAYCQENALGISAFENMRAILGYTSTQKGPDSLLPLLAMKQKEASTLKPDQQKRRRHAMNKLMYIANPNWLGVGYVGIAGLEDSFASQYGNSIERICLFNDQASVKVGAYRKEHNPRRNDPYRPEDGSKPKAG